MQSNALCMRALWQVDYEKMEQVIITPELTSCEAAYIYSNDVFTKCWINIWISLEKHTKTSPWEWSVKPFSAHLKRERISWLHLNIYFLMALEQTKSCWYSLHSRIVCILTFYKFHFSFRDLFLCRTVDKHTFGMPLRK